MGRRRLRKRVPRSGGPSGHREPEVALGDDGLVVSVWVGLLGSPEAVEAYTAECYDDDRDGEPISPFAADVGLTFYDHDFLEVHHETSLSARGEAAFTGHSYGPSFAEGAWDAAGRGEGPDFDTSLLLYGYDHRRRAAAGPPKLVRFVGTFPYVVVHDEWFLRLLRGDTE